MDALDLARRAAERGDQPETLSDIRDRARYASEWLDRQAALNRANVAAMLKSDAEAHRWERGHELGTALAREDAGRILASIADALDRVV